jgi:hypothetical protein
MNSGSAVQAQEGRGGDATAVVLAVLQKPKVHHGKGWGKSTPASGACNWGKALKRLVRVWGQVVLGISL